MLIRKQLNIIAKSCMLLLMCVVVAHSVQAQDILIQDINKSIFKSKDTLTLRSANLGGLELKHVNNDDILYFLESTSVIPINGTHDSFYNFILPNNIQDGLYALKGVNAGDTTEAWVIRIHSVDYGNSNIAPLGFNIAGQGIALQNRRDVVQIATNITYSLALLSDGTIRGWGDSSFGQIKFPQGLTKVVKIVAGTYHGMALLVDGTVVSWGATNKLNQPSINFGQTTIPSNLNQVIDISAGDFHSVALKSNRTVVAWGKNDFGQSTIPDTISDVVQIEAGSTYSIILKQNHTATQFGSLANTPLILDSITQIAAGASFVIAVKEDSTLLIWGRNPIIFTNKPPITLKITQIKAGIGHAIALTKDSTIYVWGENIQSAVSNIPPFLRKVYQIAAGGYQSYAFFQFSAPDSLRYENNTIGYFKGTVRTIRPALQTYYSPVKFSLLENLNNRIKIDTNTGILTVVDSFTQGRYNFQVKAYNSIGSTVANIVLDYYETPIQINYIDQLDSIGRLINYPLSASYVLMRNLDVKNPNHYSTGLVDSSKLKGVGFVPIASGANQFFSGKFDGNGYTIKGLYINSGGFAALFANTQNAIIVNLGLSQVAIKGAGGVAGLVALANDYIRIDNCFVQGTIESSASGFGVGGLISQTDTGFISNSFAIVDVFGGTGAGGFIGADFGRGINIVNCYARGTLSFSQSGFYSGAGGFVGRSLGASNYINCYTRVIVTNRDAIISLISSGGSFIGSAAQADGDVNFMNCYGVDNKPFNGFDLEADPVKLIHSIPTYTLNTNPEAIGKDTHYLFRLNNFPILYKFGTKILMDSQEVITAPKNLNYGNSDTLRAYEGLSRLFYPNINLGTGILFGYQILQSTNSQIILDTNTGVLGWGINLKPGQYQVIIGLKSSTGNLQKVINILILPAIKIYYLDVLDSIGTNPQYPNSGGYILMRNLSYDSVSHFSNPLLYTKYNTIPATSFTPIGTASNPFKGLFNGNGYSINKLKINLPTTNNVGMFGYVDGAYIVNLNLRNIDITGNTIVGGIVGFSNTIGLLINNVSTTGIVKGNGTVGGVVGSVINSLITNSYTLVNVTGSNTLGGFAGILRRRVLVYNSYARGNIFYNGNISSPIIGGFVGTFEYGLTKDCYSQNKITFANNFNPSLQNIGSFVGVNNNAVFRTSYATSPFRFLGSGVLLYTLQYSFAPYTNTTPNQAIGNSNQYLYASNQLPVLYKLNSSILLDSQKTVYEVPDSPTITAVLAGNQSAVVYFKAPLYNGGMPILFYTVTAMPSGQIASSVTSPIIVSNLINDSVYRFQIKASNAIGQSVASSLSQPVQPRIQKQFISTFINNGSITQSDSLSFNDTLVVTYSPNTGYSIDSVFINDRYVNPAVFPNNQIKLYNIRIAIQITIKTKLKQFTIQTFIGRGGFITPGINNANYFVPFTVKWFVEKGYKMDSVVVNGKRYTNMDSFVFRDINAHGWIGVFTSPIIPMVSIQINKGGQTSINGRPFDTSLVSTSYIPYLSQVYITIVAKENFIIDSLLVNNRWIDRASENQNESQFNLSLEDKFYNLRLNDVTGDSQIKVIFKPIVKPPTVSNVFAIAGNNEASIRFDFNSSKAYSQGLYFTVVSNPGNFVIQGRSSPIVVKGLENNINYTFNVIATNSIGSSEPVTSNSVTPTGNAFLIAKQYNSGGIININPNLNVVSAGANVNLQVQAYSGYTIDSVIINDTTQILGAQVLNFTKNINNIQSNLRIKAVFKPILYSITAQAINPGGGIAINDRAIGQYNTEMVRYNGLAYIVIRPNFGYEIESVFIGNRLVNLASEAILKDEVTTVLKLNNIRGDSTIAARFVKTSNQLSVSHNYGGWLSPSGIRFVPKGASITVAIHAFYGYSIDSIWVNGMYYALPFLENNPLQNNTFNSYTFLNIQGDSNLKVQFKRTKFLIYSGYNTMNHQNNFGGFISPQGFSIANLGDNKTYNIRSYGLNSIQSITLNKTQNIPVSNTMLQSYTFKNIQGDSSIEVAFERRNFIIRTQSIGNGFVNPYGWIVLSKGGSFVLNIVPLNNNFIDSVYVNGVKQTISNNSLSIQNIQQDLNVMAYFSKYAPNNAIGAFADEIPVYTLTSSCNIPNILNIQGDFQIDSNQNFTYRFFYDSTYSIDSLFVNGILTTATGDSVAFNNISSNQNLRLVLKRNILTLMSFQNGLGTISPSGSVEVNRGSSYTYTFYPNNNNLIDSVFANGILVNVFSLNSNTGGLDFPDNGAGYYGLNSDGSATYTFNNIQADTSKLRVVFRSQQFTLSSSQNAGGACNQIGDVIVNAGGSFRYFYTPNNGFTIDSVLIDDIQNFDSLSSYTFDNINTNHRLRIVYKKDVYLLTVTNSINGIISPQNDQEITAGSSRTIILQANTGYKIGNLLINGEVVQNISGSNTLGYYNLNNIEQDINIYAIFVPQTYQVTTQSNTGGAISPDFVEDILSGSNQDFTITSNLGFVIDSIFVNGKNVSFVKPKNGLTTYIYSMLNITGDSNIRVVFSLRKFPINLVSVQTTNPTCYGTSGSVLIKTNDTNLTYKLVLLNTVSNIQKIVWFKDTSYLLTNIFADTMYQLSVLDTNYMNSKRSFSIVLQQPQLLNAFTNYNGNTKEIQLDITGSNHYTITLNGHTWQTNDNKIKLPLRIGINKIKINTDQTCQGSFEETILVSDNLTLYPNPAHDNATLNVGGNDDKVTVSILSPQGSIVLTKEYLVGLDRNIRLDVSQYSPGVYIIKVQGSSKTSVMKLLKQ
ncbi:MAG: T9SS type A sorting domain-containing protein [Alphaproteobacteria bacterium]|nr:T9SS type A sorting domain-containing protein [Alphaproteobacteria bacterium]